MKQLVAVVGCEVGSDDNLTAPLPTGDVYGDASEQVGVVVVEGQGGEAVSSYGEPPAHVQLVEVPQGVVNLPLQHHWNACSMSGRSSFGCVGSPYSPEEQLGSRRCGGPEGLCGRKPGLKASC